MKKFFFTFLILLLTATSHKPKETFKDTIFYVTDPNGIFLFSDPKDIRNRITAPYKTGLVSLGIEKFSIPTKNNEEEEKYFEKFLYKQKIYYVEEDNSNKFIKLEPPNSDLYTYTQVSNATIYSLPFKDSKVIQKLPEYSKLEVVSIFTDNFFTATLDQYRFNEFSWTEIRLPNNKSGFILNKDILNIDSLDKIKLSLKNKMRDETGIFQVTTEKPKFYEKLEDLEKLNSNHLEDKDHLPKQGMYAQVIRSLEIEGVRYYQIERLNLKHKRFMSTLDGKELKESEIYFWISEKQGKYFSNREFTKHSFQNSKYKKDSYLFKIFEWKFSGAVNYDTLKLWKYFSKKSNSEFYLINFQYGIDGNFYYLIIERKGNQFKEVFVGIENIMALEAQVFSQIVGDMDGDGYPEFIGGYTTRGGGVTEDQLYTFKNGEIKFIANLTDRCNSEFVGNILNCYSIEEKREEGKVQEVKKIFARYKFVKGKLYKEAAKDKWEEVKSESGD